MASARALAAVDLRKLWDPPQPRPVFGRDAVKAAWLRAKAAAR